MLYKCCVLCIPIGSSVGKDAHSSLETQTLTEGKEATGTRWADLNTGATWMGQMDRHSIPLTCSVCGTVAPGCQTAVVKQSTQSADSCLIRGLPSAGRGRCVALAAEFIHQTSPPHTVALSSPQKRFYRWLFRLLSVEADWSQKQQNIIKIIIYFSN